MYRLMSLGAVTSGVSTFRGVPSIFATSPIPPSATGRYIVVRDAHSDEPWDTKQMDQPADGYVGSLGRIVVFDIGIYEDQTGDGSALENLSKIVRDAFHRYQLPVSGFGTLIARASGPINASDDEIMENQVEGRIVTVSLTVIVAS